MQTETRKRLDAGAWSAALGRLEQSGLSVAQFCEREGLGMASLYRWRSILRPGTKRRRARPKVKPEEPATEFLDLGTVNTKGSEPAHMEVRLDLGDGLVLQIIRS